MSRHLGLQKSFITIDSLSYLMHVDAVFQAALLKGCFGSDCSQAPLGGVRSSILFAYGVGSTAPQPPCDGFALVLDIEAPASPLQAALRAVYLIPLGSFGPNLNCLSTTREHHAR
jgi:hypothetical protein